MGIRLAVAAFISLGLVCPPSLAQVTRDDGAIPGFPNTNLNTVVNSVPNGAGITYVITGGTAVDTAGGTDRSLFHSFNQFSLITDDQAVFNVAATPNVDSIFGRILGGVSNINGIIAITGNAAGTTPDLFLLNPAGIIFGPNAQLALPGSFLATSANRLDFQNGAVFSVSDQQTPALLTISTPTGLQLGSAAGSITVNGNGHNVAKTSTLGPHFQIDPTPGLQVFPGQTLALVGNGIDLNRGVLTAASGNLEIGSIASGQSVDITSIPTGFAFNYADTTTFADIDLSQQSLANVSGLAVLNPMTAQPNDYFFSSQQGRLQAVGQQISLTEASLLLGQNGLFAPAPGGEMIVQASETLFINGSDAARSLRSGIASETIGATASGDILLSARDVVIEGGSGITNTTFTNANSGQIQAQIENSLSITGFNPANPLLTSTMSSGSFSQPGVVSTGNAGNVTVSSPQIRLRDGGGITVSTFNAGLGGALQVISDNIFISGRAPVSFIPASISTSNFGPGSAGDLSINTRQLQIEETATVAATSSGDGSAGNIFVTATEKIEVIDLSSGSSINSGISSAIVRPSAVEIALLGLNPIPSGDAGNVTVVTPELTVDGLGGVSVRNSGVGDAGTVRVRSERVTLRNGAVIRAVTREGSGGNIDLTATDFLLLRNESQISTESRSIGDGGNITLVTPAIVALENSDIFADAVQGNGGNIDITTQILLGTAFRERRTAESDITASSEFGLSGIVAIDGFVTNPDADLVQLPEEVGDGTDQVAQGCSVSGDNTFVATGRGGVPSDPTDGWQRDRTWADTRTLSTTTFGSVSQPVVTTPTTATVIEATTWQTSTTGQVEFVAPTPVMEMAYATCDIGQS